MIKRYYQDYRGDWNESPTGKWVKFNDYAAEVERLTKALREIANLHEYLTEKPHKALDSVYLAEEALARPQESEYSPMRADGKIDISSDTNKPNWVDVPKPPPTKSDNIDVEFWTAKAKASYKSEPIKNAYISEKINLTGEDLTRCSACDRLYEEEK